MGIYKYLHNTWKKPKENLGAQAWKEHLMTWRRDPSTLRIDYPTKLTRARSLGYRAKKGVFLVRQRTLRGGHQREWKGGRKSSNMRNVLVMEQNYQHIAERRVAKQYPGCEVLNSYLVAKDGQHYWFEVILVDRNSPTVLNDKQLSWTNDSNNKERVFRGLTSAAKRSRGLRWKGKGAEKARPSRAVTASAKGERHNKSPEFLKKFHSR
jgi:large subunit ribosomal protein L15e